MSDDKKAVSMEPSSITPTPMEVGEAESLKLNANQTDAAAAFLNSTESYEPLPADAEKKMIRRTDWILLPMVSCSRCYLASERQLTRCLRSSFSSPLSERKSSTPCPFPL